MNPIPSTHRGPRRDDPMASTTSHPASASVHDPIDPHAAAVLRGPARRGRGSLAVLAAASLLALGACGGGGGGGGNGGGGGPASLTITGTAATGAAIANAAVAATCATGTGTAMTGTDGSFQMQIPGAVAPCVLRVDAAGGPLHSVVPAGSGGATANLTPLAELIVARAHGADPEDLVAHFDAAAQAQLTAAALTAARDAVIAALQPGVDLAGLDPIAGDARVGGVLDQRLDQFTALLAARQVTLPDLVAAIDTGTTAAATRLLEPAAATCDGLRSGPFRLVLPAGDRNAGVTQFDATTLAYTSPDGTDGTLTDNGGCSFTTTDGATVLLSKSGFAVVITAGSNGKPPALVFGMPEQQIALAELAGTWNYVSYIADLTAAAPALAPRNGSFALDGAGHTTANLSCVDLDACTDAGAVADLVPAAGGGLQRNTAGGPEAYYVFKTDNGHYVMVGVIQNATRFGYFVATPQAARTLPAVGDTTLVRSLTVDSQLEVSAINDNTFLVTSVDATAQTFTRQRQQDGRMETLEVNVPRSGMLHRQPGAAAPIVILPLAGNAASVFTSADPTHNFFGASVQHP